MPEENPTEQTDVAPETAQETAPEAGKPTPKTVEDSYFKREAERLKKELEKVNRSKMTADEAREADRKAAEERANAAEAKLSELEFKDSFRAQAEKAGVKNVRIAMLLAREEGVKMIEGTLIGAEAFFAKLRKEEPGLFGGSTSGGGRLPLHNAPAKPQGALQMGMAEINANIRRSTGYHE